MTKKVLCFLARPSGLRCLEALVSESTYHVIALFTHKKKPKSEDVDRGVRTEFHRFQEVAARHSIPLFTIDTKNENETLASLEDLPDFDYLLSCSWRYLIPMSLVNRARIGSVNLHRGKLPEYKGTEPVKRMLQDNVGFVTLTAHVMIEEIDAGKILGEISMPATCANGESIEAAAERLKKTLEPHYPKLMMQALKKLEEESHVGIHHR